MSSLRNIALVGASGSLGSPILKKLQAANTFNIKVLRRNGSTATFPESVNVVDVDFDSVESLTAALKGQDAVVSAAGTMQIAGQTLIVDAAIAAGVKRFLPSEFGCDLDNTSTRKLPVYTQKVQVQDYIIEKSKSNDFSYTFVYNGAFLDWGIDHGFLLTTADGKPSLIDGGDLPFSTTTLNSVADAVVGVLNHPDETKNRAVFIEDAKVTQNKLLKLAKQAAPSKVWEPTYPKLDDLTAKADERLSQGLLDFETFVPYLYRAVLSPGYGGNFDKTDNELLGVKGVTDADILALFKKSLN